MKNALAAIGEVMTGFGLLALAVVIPVMIEPHLGSLVKIPVEMRWRYHVLAGICGLLGAEQLFAVARTWLRARLWVARAAVFISGVLAAVFYKIDFWGILPLAGMIFLGNLLATFRWELREAERASAE